MKLSLFGRLRSIVYIHNYAQSVRTQSSMYALVLNRTNIPPSFVTASSSSSEIANFKTSLKINFPPERQFPSQSHPTLQASARARVNLQISDKPTAKLIQARVNASSNLETHKELFQGTFEPVIENFPIFSARPCVRARALLFARPRLQLTPGRQAGANAY